MKLKLTLVVAMTLACASIQLTAMPTEEETRKAEPVVKKLLAQERAAFESGKKTRSEVAAAAMKLAGEADTDAAKLLLMKGAFALYVKDGNLEKAVETMRTLEAAISDMPPQSVTNMIEMALLGVSRKVDGARIYKLLDGPNADIPSNIDLPSHIESKAIAASVKERSSVASILKGMIKLPGRDCWLSATELTQGQWESVMGYNLSSHKGANLPVENVSRDDCDVFLEKLNATKEVQDSQFEFCLPELEEWKYAAWAGSGGDGAWIKPGVVGDILDMAWVKENSSNRTHDVATKTANAFGFYDMLGNVWEWLLGDSPKGGGGAVKGCAFNQPAGECTWQKNWYHVKTHRMDCCGLRLAAHKRSRPIYFRSGAARGPEEGMVQKAIDGGYTWSFFVRNGEATIVSEMYSCAVSPTPTGDFTIPEKLVGVKVRCIGREAFKNCTGLKSVTIPEGVKVIEWEAFRNCKELTAVTIPEGVTHIDSSAFADCGELKSVILPSSLKVLGRGAFGKCVGLTSIAIPEGMASIGNDAFTGCSGLKSVMIPNSVTNIGECAFLGCRGLTSVTIPAKVTSIGEGAFGLCSGLKQINVADGNQAFALVDGVLYPKTLSVLLACPGTKTSVTIPLSVTRIGMFAFGGCNGLKSVMIPQGVKSIGDSAFKGCGTLTSVTIPSGVTRILQWTFEGCSALESVTIQGNVARFGHQAFLNCHELSSFVMCGGRPEAPYDIFQGCDKLKAIHVSANAKSWSGMEDWLGIPLVFDGVGDKRKSVPDAVNTTDVKLPYEVVDGAVVLGKSRSFGFGRPSQAERNDERKTTVVKVTSGELIIPDVIDGIPVRSIGTGAFADCKGLVSVTIPSSVTSIAENAFAERNGMPWSLPISGLKSFSVAADNPSYSSRNGMLCTKDGSILVAGVIGVNGNVTIPSSVTSIGPSAFSNCSGLRCVTIPDSVTSIGSGAFRNCRGLISVAIPSSVGRIGHGAFYGCSGLTSVTIADGVASIGDSAFSGCEKLKSVTIPSSVESIGRSAFFRCGSIVSFLVGAENANYKSINGMLLSKDGTTLVAGVNGEVAIPDGVTSIGEAAFFTRWSLRSVTMPDSVTSIGEAAFLSCSALKGVTIPDSVTNIGERAFTGFNGSFTVGNNNPSYKSISGLLLTKDGTTLVAGWGVKGDVAIPNGVTNIKEIAFFNCSLTSVMMPSSVTSIGRGAFDECSRLTSVTIGDGVTSIGRGAFCFCSGLTTVKMLGERPDAPNDIFKGCKNLKSIHVPANAKSWEGMKDWFGIPIECEIEANH